MDMIIAGIVVALTVILGFVVYIQDHRKLASLVFVFLCFSMAGWTMSSTLTNHYFEHHFAVNVISNHLAYLFGYLAVVSGLAFSLVFPVREQVSRGVAAVSAVVIVVTCLLSLTDSVAGTVTVQAGELNFSNGPLLLPYAISFLLIVGLLSKNLLASMKQTKNILHRQAKLVLMAFVFTALIGLLTNVILPLMGLSFEVTTRFAPLAALVLTVTIAYAIIRHSLFDIKLAAVRTTAYVLSLLTLSALYYLLAYVVSVTLFQGETSSAVSINPVNILLALLLAFIFQPIKNFFDKVTNDIFFRDRYDSDEFFARLSEVLATTPDLRDLLSRAAHEIGTTLKSEQTFFFVQYGNVHHVTAGTAHHTGLPVHDVHYLNEYVKKHGDSVLVTELLGEKTAVRRLLISHKISLLMPLVRGSTTLGYLALGEARSSGYTNRDIKVLRTVSDELIIAIQNALSVQEVRDINAHLEQRITAATAELRTSNGRLRRIDATKDEFLSMASHQLRTPLTSVKGYLSMVLDGDAGKVTASQAKLLGEAYASSERMVHLINDFLNVSRLQTGKFMLERQMTNLAELIQGEVKSLQTTAKSRGIKLRVDVTKAPAAELFIDEAKIRQVVMNFIDNALYYSHEHDTIDVTVRQVKNEVEVTVKDTGIGVPKSEQAHLFTKFYRATNARRQRPDGTGVGLFLTKKVIDAHHGSIIFNSVENEGSTFGFRLPITKKT